MKWLLLISCWGLTLGWGQDSLLAPAWRLGGLPQANQLIVDEEENLILLDTERAGIYRYLAAYGYDSLLFMGGRSNRQEGLVHPIQMSLQNRQALYVLDDATGRLLVLNPNLRIVQTQEYMNQRSGMDLGGAGGSLFPVAFAVGPLGEQFLINRSDNRVVKINAFGEEEIRFGGADYGPGALYDPADIAIDQDNFVYVADTSEQTIQVYDLYGVYRYRLSHDPGFRWQQFRLFRPWVIYFSGDRVAVMNLASEAWLTQPFDWPPKIWDVFLRGDYLYVLSDQEIQAFALH